MAISHNVEFYRETLFKIINIDTFENEHWEMLDMLEKEKDFFSLALALGDDLHDAILAHKVTFSAQKVCDYFISELRNAKGQYQDFHSIVKDTPSEVIYAVMSNPSFPIELLVEDKYYTKFEETDEYEEMTQVRAYAILHHHRLQAVSYLRDKLGLENTSSLSDDMIFSIVGIGK
jgi:hypothetical protein